ncbi:glycine cleavage system protein GcvH [Streptomyces cavernicola]|uniref:Glycine cleavage system protein GcvH n=1 Tax=Streptomyces cavernicola TaxID=3043613 RepID=A0ABT6SP84_9ACTN|nr:glycine cleavage system protein GcvH [Streptomyces sp. B-S-A6]MDI3409492.1 glycine cleavage system protein GcvH [Streptomyces sp. B-S-A6]
MTVPPHLRYTWDHEWLAIEAGNGTVGVTEFATRTLGDVVSLRLPEVGSWVEAGETCGQIASPTAVSELYAPASGHITEVNTRLVADPSMVNSTPYDGGWLFKLRVENIAGALSADAYAAHCALTQGARR